LLCHGGGGGGNKSISVVVVVVVVVVVRYGTWKLIKEKLIVSSISWYRPRIVPVMWVD
jgi:hypothetical protein